MTGTHHDRPRKIAPSFGGLNDSLSDWRFAIAVIILVILTLALGWAIDEFILDVPP